jgi:hypothetical protein
VSKSKAMAAKTLAMKVTPPTAATATAAPVTATATTSLLQGDNVREFWAQRVRQ